MPTPRQFQLAKLCLALHEAQEEGFISADFKVDVTACGEAIMASRDEGDAFLGAELTRLKGSDGQRD